MHLLCVVLFKTEILNSTLVEVAEKLSVKEPVWIYQLRVIAKVESYLLQKDLETVLRAFITYRLDYY